MIGWGSPVEHVCCDGLDGAVGYTLPFGTYRCACRCHGVDTA